MLDIKEILISISIAQDYANGRKPEFTLKLALVSVFLAKLSNLSKREIHLVYLASLLKSLGCTSYSPEEAQIFSGDDISFKSIFSTVDSINKLDAYSHLKKLSSETKWKELKMKFNLVINASSLFQNIVQAHCESAGILIKEINLDSEISTIINDTYERYDGKGVPNKKKKKEIHFLSRIISLSYFFLSLSEITDQKTIIKKLTLAKGKMFDPELVDLLLGFISELNLLINSNKIHEDAMFISPNIYVESLKSVAILISYLADFKSRYTSLHSKKVSELALYLAKKFKLSEVDQNNIYISALIMNIGMVCIPTGILEMERKLNPTEKERIETHTYYTDKILSRSKLLTPYIEYCISHHETLKGTGYHRRLKELNLSQSILIYSDKVIALGSERSHRKAYSNKEILEILKLEIQEGKLEKKIYPYIEEYLGFKNKINKLSQNIFALTEREIEVLRYISEGYTNKQIAKKLNISDRTVQHHSIHIYEKMGVRTRSAAVMLGYKEKILQV